MKAYKYSGAGNDFVLIDNREGKLSDYPALARRLCSPETGLGTDGLMVLENPQAGGDIKMCFYNNDGSEAEMCGNGARCLCRHCHDFGISGERQVLETRAGVVTGERISENQYKIQLNSPSETKLQMKAEGRLCDYVVLGENGIPHGVFPRPDLSRDDLRKLGRTLRFSDAFPRGANINFYKKTGENQLRLLTYERGVEDFTPACGTGTGATVYALTRRGIVSGQNTEILSEGGTLRVDIDGSKIFLTGPADRLWEGNLDGGDKT